VCWSPGTFNIGAVIFVHRLFTIMLYSMFQTRLYITYMYNVLFSLLKKTLT